MLRVLTSLAAAFVVAGCAGTSSMSTSGPSIATLDAGGITFFAAKPGVPVDPTKPFDTVTCNWDGLPGKTKCLVSVSAKMVGPTCVAKAPNVILDKPDKTFVLIWLPTDDNLNPAPEYRFCPLLGDGTYLKDVPGSDDEQFDDTWAGDDAGNGTDPTKYKGKDCFKRSRMRAENSSTFTKKEYSYQVLFRNKQTGAKCVADPFIKNG